jgi:hypothetical protein
MRTTIDIRDRVLERVKEYAAGRSVSRGQAVSDLLERSLNSDLPTIWENGLMVFDPGPGSETLTLERTLQLEDAMESELD